MPCSAKFQWLHKLIFFQWKLSISQINKLSGDIYSISSVIRLIFFFRKNPKILDLPYKMDLDLWDCLERFTLMLLQSFKGLIKLFVVILEKGKTLSNSQINTVIPCCMLYAKQILFFKRNEIKGKYLHVRVISLGGVSVQLSRIVSTTVFTQ